VHPEDECADSPPENQMNPHIHPIFKTIITVKLRLVMLSVLV
jgi:hypothetical protein